MRSSVVVVESPAKAKTIVRYLGRDYRVIASYGHVRDLSSKEGAVNPDQDFAMKWEVNGQGRKQIETIKSALKGADHLYLATDPDREGEAISWHLVEELSRGSTLKGVDISRVRFHELTKSSILAAFDSPSEINLDLVHAYLARRGLDHLMGYTLSPILWRRLPAARSAGRVQSVTLGLVTSRELEISAFKSREYWSLTAHLHPKGKPDDMFHAGLSNLDGKKVEKFSITTKKEMEAVAARVAAATWFVAEVEEKTAQRQPKPPFITSTLQQESSRKLGLSTWVTMQVAQRLYEGMELPNEGQVGLITYMRTDGTNMNKDAVEDIRSLIAQRYSPEHVSERPRVYRSRVKNAQEAHEAIRPTDIRRTPDKVRAHLSDQDYRVYDLIWRRAVACQMSSAVFARKTCHLESAGDAINLRANGQRLVFKGFLDAYDDGGDDQSESTKDSQILPNLVSGDSVSCPKVEPKQHFTQPPPRYSESSLIRQMEEEGIGRPSTYSSTLRLLRDRKYVEVRDKRLEPVNLGMLVTALLEAFFDRYMQPNFTASLEEKLDDVSAGDTDWQKVLSEFWEGLSERSKNVMALPYTDVRDALDARLAGYFHSPILEDPEKGRQCPRCNEGRLILNAGRYGAYFVCSQKDCSYRFNAGSSQDSGTDQSADQPDDLPRVLGTNADTSEVIELRQGPYGLYVQATQPDSSSGEDKKSKGKKSASKKPRRAGLLKGMKADDVDMEKALILLSLPRLVGQHPESKEEIRAGCGPYGPYLLYQKKYHKIVGDDATEVLTIGINRAVQIIADSIEGRGGQESGRGQKKPQGKELGKHSDGSILTVGAGRYGPYVYDGKIYAPIPASTDPNTIELDEAIRLVDKKREKKKAAGPKSGAAAGRGRRAASSSKKG